MSEQREQPGSSSPCLHAVDEKVVVDRYTFHITSLIPQNGGHEITLTPQGRSQRTKRVFLKAGASLSEILNVTPSKRKTRLPEFVPQPKPEPETVSDNPAPRRRRRRRGEQLSSLPVEEETPAPFLEPVPEEIPPDILETVSALEKRIRELMAEDGTLTHATAYKRAIAFTEVPESKLPLIKSALLAIFRGEMRGANPVRKMELAAFGKQAPKANATR